MLKVVLVETVVEPCALGVKRSAACQEYPPMLTRKHKPWPYLQLNCPGLWSNEPLHDIATHY